MTGKQGILAAALSNDVGVSVARHFPHNPISSVISAAGSINLGLFIGQEYTVQTSRLFFNVS